MVNKRSKQYTNKNETKLRINVTHVKKLTLTFMEKINFVEKKAKLALKLLDKPGATFEKGVYVF